MELEDKILVYIYEKQIGKDKVEMSIQLGLNPGSEKHKDIGRAVAMSNLPIQNWEIINTLKKYGFKDDEQFMKFIPKDMATPGVHELSKVIGWIIDRQEVEIDDLRCKIERLKG